MKTELKFAEFVLAQDLVYADVQHELRNGRKESHWIWFIFPQILGLGFSPMSQKFGIDSLAEAQSYLKHSILGPRLKNCTQLLIDFPSKDISSILGFPDDLKFCSSMTLFAIAAPEEALFESALQKFFRGQRDTKTINLLAKSSPTKSET